MKLLASMVFPLWPISPTVNVDSDFEDRMEWHFNRKLGQNPDAAILAYSNNIEKQTLIMQDYLASPSSHNCNEALKTFGRLTHAYQDYYAHAVHRNYNRNYPVGPVGGSPDSPWGASPSSWGGKSAPGEHSWVEPGWMANDSSERAKGAVEFTRTKTTELLNDFWKSCGCIMKMKSAIMGSIGGR